MSSRPTRFTAAHIDWKVKWVKPPKGALGDCDTSNQTVRIDPSLPKRTAQHVLTHEVLHAIWWSYSLNPDAEDLEESVVSQLGGPLMEVVSNNDKLRAYLFPA